MLSAESVRKLYNEHPLKHANEAGNKGARYSEELKKESISKVLNGMTQKAVAEFYNISPSTVRNFMKSYKDGNIHVEKQEIAVKCFGHRYTKQTKEVAVERLNNGEEIPAVARAMNISKPTLYRWIDNAKRGEAACL